jgi:hypothetical protein
MKTTVLHIKCLLGNISPQSIWFSQTKVTSIASLFDGIMLGHLVESRHDGVIFLSVAQGMICEIYINAADMLFRYSILPALSLDGVVHLEVLDHPFNGEEFGDFVEGVLDRMQPWPLPQSVLVMDNASIHKVPGIREMVEER